MESKSLWYFTFYLLFLTLEIKAQSCQPPKVYSTCGPACPPKCKDALSDVPKPECLNKRCNEGCFCPDSLFEDTVGNCLTRKECLISISKNCTDPNAEIRLDNPCQPRCINGYVVNETQTCEKKMVLGCYCKHGYILNEKGECIRNVCKSCGPNKYYSTTATKCPAECRNGELRNALNQKCPPGCTCITGYVLLIEDGSCIHPRECTPVISTVSW